MVGGMAEGEGIEPSSFRMAGFQGQWQTLLPAPSAKSYSVISGPMCV